MALQHPLRRKYLPRQPFLQHRRLIEGFGQRLEDCFHDVVRVAAIHEIHVQIEPSVRNEGLEKIFEQAEIEGLDLPIRQLDVIDEIGPAAEIDGDLSQRFIERSRGKPKSLDPRLLAQNRVMGSLLDFAPWGRT